MRGQVASDPSQNRSESDMKSLAILGLAAPILWIVTAQAAEPRRPAPVSTLIQSGESGAEIVGKLLKPRPSDPDVPLPAAGLSDDIGGNSAGTRPQIYGREQSGGAIFGLKFPIPVRNGDAGSATRYSSGVEGPKSGLESR
jgi:hypothetical protein